MCLFRALLQQWCSSPPRAGRRLSLRPRPKPTPRRPQRLPRPHQPYRRARNGPIRCVFQMRNVALHVADGVVLERAHARRRVREPRRWSAPGLRRSTLLHASKFAPPIWRLDAASLTRLIQAADSRPRSITDPRRACDDRCYGALHAAGKLHKGVTVPFSMTAEVSALNDGSLRLHARKAEGRRRADQGTAGSSGPRCRRADEDA